MGAEGVPAYQAALDAPVLTPVAESAPTASWTIEPKPTPAASGTLTLVDDNEKGPKDTVRANPAQMTRIKVNFDIRGDYVWHSTFSSTRRTTSCVPTTSSSSGR